MAVPFKLYNTLTRSIEDFEPLNPGQIHLYVCGMTVYDHCHVGHARAMVVYDCLVRYLRHRNWKVTFVRNFTDVDDKIISRAKERDIPASTLAQEFIDAFHEDVANLGLIKPDIEPRVSTSIEAIKKLIAQLVETGHAYSAEGSVWFSVSSFPQYGALSGQKVSDLRSADENAGKKSGTDFALWKTCKPGEPSWDSPWGPGRPGWHIECSAMASEQLGTTIDIHGGGLDLVFPHHENEIAQSECAHNAKYVRYWMHNGLLTLSSGQKMGKSLGNVINIRDALADFPAEAIRLYYLQNHYRSPLPWGPDALPKALAMLARLYNAIEQAGQMSGTESPDVLIEALGADAREAYDLGHSLLETFYKALDTDFNTAAGLAAVFETARAINRFSNHKKAKKRGAPIVQPALNAIKTIGEAIGLLSLSPDAFHEEVKTKSLKAMGIERHEIESLLEERANARSTKDWPKADEIRGILISKRIQVMDRPEGVTWRVALTQNDA